MLDEILHFISGATLAIALLTSLRFRKISPGPRRYDHLWLNLILWCLTINALHPMITRAISGPTLANANYFEPIQFLIAPLLSGYIKSLENNSGPWRAKNILHLLPFFAVGSLVIVLNLSHTKNDFLTYSIWLCLSLQSAIYLVYNLKKIHSLRKNLAKVVSSFTHFDPKWLKFFSIVLVSLHVLSISFFVALAHGASTELVMLLMSSSLLFAVASLSVRGPDQRQIPQIPNQEAQEVSPGDQFEAQKIRTLIEEKSLYLNPELCLEDLAQAAGLPRNRVSFLINTVLGSSFYDLINGYRYEAFVESINDPSCDHEKLLTLAFDAGFNSKPTFNKIVLARSGETPSTLRRLKKESRTTQ